MAQQYQPAYFQPPARQGNGFGVTALVLGIVGVVISFIPILGFGAFVLGPIAVIFGIVGVVQANRPKGMAIVGMVLGVASIIIAAVVTTAFFRAVSPETEGSTSSQSDAAAPPADSAPAEAAPGEAAPEVMSVESAQLLQDFDDNEAAADQKYAGKILEVTGSVSKVDTEFLDDTKYVVRLDDGSQYSFATVNCNDIPTDQAVAAVPDSTITIRGAFDDGGDLGIELKDCVIL